MSDQAVMRILEAIKVQVETFEYTDPIHGTRRFNIDAIKPYAELHAKRLIIDITPEFVSYAKDKVGVDLQRAANLPDLVLDRPIISIEDEGCPYLIIDGHHRIVRRFMDGIMEAKCYHLLAGQWEQFLMPVEGPLEEKPWAS